MLTRLLNVVLRPHFTLLLAILAGIICWLIPASPVIRKGYDSPEPLTSASLLVLIVWYGIIFGSAILGYSGGRSLPKPSVVTNSPDDKWSYRIFTLIAFTATFAVYLKLYQSGVLLRYVSNYTSISANVLRDALYEDYHIGIYSFRYVVSLAGGIAAYRMLIKGKVALLDAVNVVMLLMISALSSRLTMMIAAFVVVGLLAGRPGLISRSTKVRVLIATLFFGVAIWTYNYSRNSSFYSTRHSDGFFLAGVSEIVAYLGGPVNVAIGVGNHWSEAVNGQEASAYVDYDFEHLTTNSVLAELVPAMGWLAFVFIAIQSLVYGCIAGWCFEQKNSPVFLACPIISYGFGELCRVNVLGMGIMFCLIGCAIGVPLVISQFLRPSGLSTRYPEPILR